MPKDILAARSSPNVRRSNAAYNLAGLAMGNLTISAPENSRALVTILIGNCVTFPKAVLLAVGRQPTIADFDGILLPDGSDYFHSCPMAAIGVPAATTTIGWLAITDNLATLTFDAGDTVRLVASITS